MSEVELLVGPVVGKVTETTARVLLEVSRRCTMVLTVVTGQFATVPSAESALRWRVALLRLCVVVWSLCTVRP